MTVAAEATDRLFTAPVVELLRLKCLHHAGVIILYRLIPRGLAHKQANTFFFNIRNHGDENRICFSFFLN